ncbi:MAG TPA: hypothetical protein VFN38_02625 [Gemmatimonadaceae bacterium]|nr:hypothetical protein [Gemmatimonadaceae bacterium]
MRLAGCSAPLVATLLLAAGGTPADAQVARGSACLDSLPASLMKRIPVYAAAEVADADPMPPAAVASMDLLTQAMAEQARALLGAGPGQLPPGEPQITWRHLDHRLFVVAHRDGRVTSRVQPPVWLSDQSLGDGGARHLGRALDSARAKGEAFFWDDGIRRDSVTWLVRLEPSLLGEDGGVAPPALRAGFPVFSVLSPSIQPADVERMRTNFPMVRIRGFSGTVRLQFVIDTAGRAVASTIRPIWPPNEARLVGPPRFAYDSLVRIMQTTLEQARFAPARIGRCTVSQLVQQAFTYRPAR